jgi:hypothetical protein
MAPAFIDSNYHDYTEGSSSLDGPAAVPATRPTHGPGSYTEGRVRNCQVAARSTRFELLQLRELAVCGATPFTPHRSSSTGQISALPRV